jgi:hypothetical protein
MTIYLSGPSLLSDDIAVPNYRSVKEILCGLLLYTIHINACISCSDLQTEKIRISRTSFHLPRKSFFSVRKLETKIQLCVHILVWLYVCTAISYRCNWRIGLNFIMKIYMCVRVDLRAVQLCSCRTSRDLLYGSAYSGCFY